MGNFQHIDGLLAVNKPAGVVSKDVSRWLVKRIGKVKLGHVGTLDPAASGVLPLLLGRATKLQDFLLEMPKSYEFDVAFGTETDTLDQDGKVVREAPWDHITEDKLEAAISKFVGNIEQTPPLFSAVKYKGKPLYDYARSSSGSSSADQVPLDALKRKVSVSSFEMLRFKPGVATFRVLCSKGTYVRSLARDLAESVGSCATLTRLVRTQAAGVAIDQSLTLDSIEAELDNFAAKVVPMAKIRTSLVSFCCPNSLVVSKLQQGQRVSVTLEDYLGNLDTSGPEIAVNDHKLVPTALAESVLLLSESGAAFGVGSVRRHESGRVEIALKRGL